MLHLVKLCVGPSSIEDLLAWRARFPPSDPWLMRTRQTPKRASELLSGGSLYWVIKGLICCRQAIRRIDTVGEGMAVRCQVTLDPDLRRTEPAPRRAFQGWRYLAAADAPRDLAPGFAEGEAPFELALELRRLGAW